MATAGGPRRPGLDWRPCHESLRTESISRVVVKRTDGVTRMAVSGAAAFIAAAFTAGPHRQQRTDIRAGISARPIPPPCLRRDRHIHGGPDDMGLAATEHDEPQRSDNHAICGDLS